MKKNNNPALREAAKEFNDSLLDAQKKKIDELSAMVKSRDSKIEYLTSKAKKTIRYGKEIARLNEIIYNKNVELTEKRKGCIKVFNENQDLEKAISDKDAVLSDVAEELRLSKKREEELVASIKDYQKEIEDLKEEKLKLDRSSIEAVDLYVNSVTRAELDGLLLDFWEKDDKGITAIYQSKGGKRTKLHLDFTGGEIIFSCSDPDKYAHKIHDEGLKQRQRRACEKFNKRAVRLSSIGSRNGDGILDNIENADLSKSKMKTSKEYPMPDGSKIRITFDWDAWEKHLLSL